MTTLRDVTGKTHSYRNHDPETIVEIANNQELDPTERLSQAGQAIRFIESGRLAEFCSATFSMFIRLDHDERQQFTFRNPDLMRWVSAWGASQEATNPLTEWRERATTALTDDGSKAADPPLFERSLGRDGLFRDMMVRRRSYRNWTPQEFEELLARGEIELSEGAAREIGWQSPEIREQVDFPLDVTADEIVRALFERIEAGRFTPAMKAGHVFFAPLDVDERRSWAARNPGFLMWISVYGQANHLIHGDQLRAGYPTLAEK